MERGEFCEKAATTAASAATENLPRRNRPAIFRRAMIFSVIPSASEGPRQHGCGPQGRLNVHLGMRGPSPSSRFGMTEGVDAGRALQQLFRNGIGE